MSSASGIASLQQPIRGAQQMNEQAREGDLEATGSCLLVSIRVECRRAVVISNFSLPAASGGSHAQPRRRAGTAGADRARRISQRAAELRRRNRTHDADALEQEFLSDPSSVNLADQRFSLKRTKGLKNKRGNKSKRTATKTPVVHMRSPFKGGQASPQSKRSKQAESKERVKAAHLQSMLQAANRRADVQQQHAVYLQQQVTTQLQRTHSSRPSWQIPRLCPSLIQGSP